MAAQHRSAFQAFAGREALVGGGVRWSYAGLAERCHRMARYFQSLGLGRQDGIAMLAGNTPEAVVVVIAAQLLGLRYTALHPMGALEDQGFVLRDAGIRLLVVDGARFAGRGAELAALGIARTVVSLGPAPFGADAVAASAAFDGSETPIEVQPDDVHKISYTGGTTGMPKGVMWPHKAFLFGCLGGGGHFHPAGPIAAPEDIAIRAREGHPLRFMPVAPLMHGAATWGSWSALLGGLTLVLDPVRHFDPEAIWDKVEREQVNIIAIVGDAMAVPLRDASGALIGGLHAIGT